MFLINEDITYSPQFSYREYEVIKQNNFRYYKIANKLVPSVTSILRLSRHNQKDTFSAKQADSFEIGNLMHSYLEKYIKKEGIETKETNNSKIAFQLCKSIIDLHSWKAILELPESSVFTSSFLIYLSR